ncbi:MAG: ABC transporter permease [Chloroflexota bacterium]|nr:ABC transporter permease [Chloroflexota bacterium]
MATKANNQPLETAPKSIDLSRFARRNGLQIGIFGVLALLWLVFLTLAPTTFGEWAIYRSFLQSVPFFGIVALTLTMLVIGREMDLSFPAIMAISVTTFVLINEATGNPWLAFVGCLLTGFLVGVLNGLIVVYIGLPSLIATIGTQFFWRGMVNVITNGRSFTLNELRDTPFRELFVGRLFGEIPMQMIWMLVVALVVWFLLNRHRFGAHVYLIGDSENSARLMGVAVNRTRILMFAFVGLASAFAGLLTALEINNFFTNLGEAYLLIGLAAVFLGGTSVFGGVGTVFGTFIGCFIIASIQPAVVAIGWAGFTTQVIYGLIIVLSVAMHTLLRQRMRIG